MKFTEKYIETTQFVKKFPSNTKKLREAINKEGGYGKVSLSYRTFRYYVTHGLMPRSRKINKKSHYLDTEVNYNRLFVVWFLTHVCAMPLPKIREFIQGFKGSISFKLALLILDNPHISTDVLSQSRMLKTKIDTYDLEYFTNASCEYASQLVSQNSKFMNKISDFCSKYPEVKGEGLDAFKMTIEKYKNLNEELSKAIKQYEGHYAKIKRIKN